MNKLALPGILVATVMVAGLFAFAPVEQASTVHQTILDSVSQTLIDSVAKKLIFEIIDDIEFVDGSNVDIIALSSTLKQGTIKITSDFENPSGMNKLVINNCLNANCDRLDTLYTSAGDDSRDSMDFLGYGIVLAESTTGTNNSIPITGTVSVIVAYNED